MRIYQKIVVLASNENLQALWVRLLVQYPFQSKYYNIDQSNQQQLNKQINQIITSIGMKTGFLTIWIIACTCTINILCKFELGKIQIVDKNRFHHVVGGPSPVDDSGNYQYQFMMGSIESKINTTGNRLLSISLIPHLTPKYTKVRYVEQNFFNQFPGRPNQAIVQRGPRRHGNFYHNYIVWGSFINPSIFPGFLRKIMAKYYKYLYWDNLDSIFELIKTQMSYLLESIIYVHSVDGLDDVSYVLGAYLLKNNKASMQQIMNNIGKIMSSNGRDSMCSMAVNGLQWYCLTIGKTNQQCMIGQDIGNFKSYNNSDNKQL